MKRSLVAIGCSLLLFGPVHAQTPPPEASPSPEVRGPAELPLLESEMAESAFLSDRSEANREILVFAYEKVLNATCFANLWQTLQYSGNPANPYCVQYIEKILRMDERNPVAICARDGLEAESCKKAFADQETRPFRFESRANKGDPGEGEVRLNQAKNQTEIDAKAGELQKQTTQYQTDPTPELKQSIEATFRSLLFLSCQITKIRLRPLSEMPPTPAPRSSIISKDPSLSSLESAIDLLGSKEKYAGRTGKAEKPEGPRPAKSAAPEDDDVYSRAMKGKSTAGAIATTTLFHRVRLITSGCADYISKALAFDPNFPQALCYRESLVAPVCVNALKKARGRRPSSQGSGQGRRKVEPGLDSF